MILKVTSLKQPSFSRIAWSSSLITEAHGNNKVGQLISKKIFGDEHTRNIVANACYRA